MVRCNVAEGSVGEGNNTRKPLGSWEAQKTILSVRSYTYSKPQSITEGVTETRMQGQGQQIEGREFDSQAAGVLRTFHPEPRAQVFLKTVAWPRQ